MTSTNPNMAWSKTYDEIVRTMSTDAAIVYGMLESYVAMNQPYKLTNAGIAKRYGWSLRKVEMIMSSLSKAGLITVTLRGPKGCSYQVHKIEDALANDDDDVFEQDPETGRVYVAKSPQKSPHNDDDSAVNPRKPLRGSYNVIGGKNTEGFEPSVLTIVRTEGSQPPTQDRPSVVVAPKRAGRYPDAPEPFRMWMAYCDVLGLDPTQASPRTKSQALGIAKRLVADGFTASDVWRCVKYMQTQHFRGSVILFSQVAANIGPWKLAGKPKEDRRRGEKINWQAGGTGRLVY